MNEKLNNYIEMFIEEIGNVYSIEINDLRNLSKDIVMEVTNSVTEENKEKSKILDINRISSMNKVELTVMCKELGLKVSGKKEELIKRILDHKCASSYSFPESKESKENKEITKTNTKTKTKTSENKKNKKEDNEEKKGPFSRFKDIIIKVRKNNFGNFEHLDTGLVFNKDDKNVIGKQCRQTGKILPLTGKDILLCKENKFDYVIPYDLNDEESKTKYSNTLKNELGDEEKEVKEDECKEYKEDDDELDGLEGLEDEMFEEDYEEDEEGNE